MSAVTVTPESREWCVKRSHPWVTYNPLLNRSYCRCGERQAAGEQPMDWDAKWAIFHDHPQGAPCRCYLPKDGNALGYLALYQGQRYELHAESAYAAQQQAIEHFKPPKTLRHLVTVHLAEKNGETVTQVITL